MKNLFLAFSVIFIVSCNNDLEESQTIIEKNNIYKLIPFEDVDELPDIDLLEPFFSSIRIDESRTSIIDTELSVLKVPVYVVPLINRNYIYFEFKGIKIARYKPKSRCKHCVDCIGFRCKPNKPTLVSFSNQSDFNDMLSSKFITNKLSVEREHDFIVKIDYDNQVLEFHSIKLIDWEKLM